MDILKLKTPNTAKEILNTIYFGEDALIIKNKILSIDISYTIAKMVCNDNQQDKDEWSFHHPWCLQYKQFHHKILMVTDMFLLLLKLLSSGTSLEI